jgi:hypothetical protein
MNKIETPQDLYKRQMGEYIAYLFRTCGATAPRNEEQRNWLIIVPSYSMLACFDSILGFNIQVVHTLGAFDFMLSIPADQESNRKFLRAFAERQDEVVFREDGDYE